MIYATVLGFPNHAASLAIAFRKNLRGRYSLFKRKGRESPEVHRNRRRSPDRHRKSSSFVHFTEWRDRASPDAHEAEWGRAFRQSNNGCVRERKNAEPSLRFSRSSRKAFVSVPRKTSHSEEASATNWLAPNWIRLGKPLSSAIFRGCKRSVNSAKMKSSENSLLYDITEAELMKITRKCGNSVKEWWRKGLQSW